MTNTKLVLALGLAAAALALVLTNTLGGPVFQITQGPVIVISALALAAGAFAVSWNQRSFAVAGLLVAAGIIQMIPGFTALANINFAVILIPGPILGVIFGLIITGLGLAKGVRMARTVTAMPQ